MKSPLSRVHLPLEELVEQGMNYRTGVLRREKCFRTAEKFLAILVMKKSCPFILPYYNSLFQPSSKLLQTNRLAGLPAKT